MATFMFYGTLKDHAPSGGITIDEKYTVGDALSIIGEQYAALRDDLFTSDGGEFREYITVVVNDEPVRFLADGMDTPLAADDVVRVFPPISGGIF